MKITSKGKRVDQGNISNNWAFLKDYNLAQPSILISSLTFISLSQVSNIFLHFDLCTNIKAIFIKNQTMKFLEKYYPILLAFFSFLYSIYLWFTGNELEGIYVGLWPITILGFAIAIRQRRKDQNMNNKLMFIIGCIIFVIYIFFYFRIVLNQKFGKKRDKKS